MDNSTNQGLVVTAFWQVNPGEEGAVAGLLKEFLPQAQQEPGVKVFQIHQNTAKPNEFFFYEGVRR
jgi:quinol monooxygenase YgiN